MPVDEIAEGMNLAEVMRGRDWYIQGCCAPSGDGLYEGIDWLVTTLGLD
jgi:ADP-ribosylation factor 1/2